MSTTTGIEFNEKNGYSYVAVDGKKEAKMTFVFAGEDTIIIDHTEVNPGYNGKGFGNKMLEKIVAFARDNQIKIIPNPDGIRIAIIGINNRIFVRAIAIICHPHFR